jgi:hypothetical protein
MSVASERALILTYKRLMIPKSMIKMEYHVAESLMARAFLFSDVVTPEKKILFLLFGFLLDQGSTLSAA